MTEIFEQYAKVVSDEVDGDETGRHWKIHYVLYLTQDDDGRKCFDLYSDDGLGNGDMISRGYNERSMRSLVLRLGRHVEWKAGVPLVSAA